jgi:hypothetical protein
MVLTWWAFLVLETNSREWDLLIERYKVGLAGSKDGCSSKMKKFHFHYTVEGNFRPI